MRFMVARDGLQTALYVIDGDKAFRVTGPEGSAGSDLMAAIENSAVDLEQIRSGARAVELSTLQPALPLNEFRKVMCLGLNYVDHVKEGGYEIPSYPAIFIRMPHSLMAAEEAMVKPDCSDRLDYEVELMVVIGKGGKHIPEEQALDHVFGYTVFNDGSVRDYQRKTHQWTPGKNFDATGAIGPIIVTADELPPGAAGLKIESRLNGKVMQSANTSEMMWPVAKTIATISEFTTLEPGDLIAMGTPPGVGHARTPPVFMFPGDVVEVEVENIGICRSPIVSEQQSREGRGCGMIKQPQKAPVGAELEALRAQTHNEIRELRQKISQLGPDGIELILSGARSHYAWQDRPVTEDTLRAIYDIVKMGPTSMNSSPARFVFVRTDEGREKLKRSLKPANVPKVVTAPVTVIIAHDTEFWKELLYLFPHEDRRPHFDGKQDHSEETAFRNGTLQGAYFMIAARALGLDVGAMSGFSNEIIDQEFFAGTTLKSNFLCNLGYADETALFHKLPRFEFDDVCSFA